MELEQKRSGSVPNSLSVAVLVLNWNGRSLLETCLPPLLNQSYDNYKVVLVDNASADDSISWVKEYFPQVQRIQNSENLGFSRGINEGLRQISADVVVLLNNDVLVRTDWLVELIRPFHNDPKIGIVGAKLLFPDGTIQHLGAELTYPLANSYHYHYKEQDNNQVVELRDVPYVTGASLAVKHAVLQKIGLLDVIFHPFYYEEVDFCTRAKAAGYRVVIAPKAVAIHDESATMTQVSDVKLRTFHKNRLRYVLKHYALNQFLHDFVPAEKAFLLQHPVPAELDQLRLAYFEAAVSPEHLCVEATADQETNIKEALLQLRLTAIRAKANASPPPPGLTEFSFPTNSGFFSTFFAWFRRTWGNIAAKWLVRSVIQQQQRQNQYQLNQIEQFHNQIEIQALENDRLLAELFSAQQKQQTLEAELALLGQQLSQLNSQVKDQS